MTPGVGDVGGEQARARYLAEIQQRPGPTSPVDRLEDRFERLLLVTDAVWSILQERFGVTVAELEQRVIALDAASGQVNGRRATAPLVRCGSCDAAIDRTRSTCAFCGAPAPPVDPFDRI